MNILFAVDEAYPLYKIGGLGDVGGSLPKALAKLGLDVRLALPHHPEITLNSQTWSETDKFDISYNHKSLTVTVTTGQLPGTKIPVHLFGEATLISQSTDASDTDTAKFAAFSLAVSHWLTSTNQSWQPDILHLHDWHTALIPVILRHLYETNDYQTIINIHNLAYQGNTKLPVDQHLGLTSTSCPILTWDHQDERLNILLQGLLHTDSIVAVSPTYAQEILTPEYGASIDLPLITAKDRIVGILNGLDLEVFNPESDPHLYQTYTQTDFKKGKQANKLALQKDLGLTVDPNLLLMGFVGRVDAGQKGVQLIISALRQQSLVDEHSQFVFLGTGDEVLERDLHQAAASLDNVKVFTRYDEPLAVKIYASSDLMPIPSKYEPCGLVQMIAMRYGALPIARKTGGLADTIIHGQDGFLFEDYSTDALIQSLVSAKEIIKDQTIKDKMISQAMRKDFSWTKSAKDYQQLYDTLLNQQKPHPHELPST